MDPDALQRGGHCGRGQANVVGLVLLMGLVVMIAMTIVVVGAQGLDEARETTQTEDATISFSEFQSEAAELSPDGESTYSIAFGESSGASTGPAPGASVEGGTEGNPRVDPTAGAITIEVSDPAGDTTVVDRNLGVIEYERGDQVLAYQGGGVFRGNVNGEEAVVSSPPPFDYQFQNGNPTLSIPIRTLNTDGNQVLTGDGFELRASSSARQFPSGPSQSNPLDPAQSITITVQSDYYLAWGDLFDERTDVEPTYDHPNDKVSITLDAETNPPPDLEGGLSASLPSGSALCYGHEAEISNYHSLPGESPSDAGTTYVRGLFDRTNSHCPGVGGSAGQGELSGNLIVADRFEIDENSNSDQFGVSGEVVAGGDPTDGDPAFISCKACEFGTSLSAGEDAMHVNDDLDLTGHNAGDLVIEGNVYVEGDVTAGSNVHITGDLHVGGDFDWSGGTQVDGSVEVGGNDNGWTGAGSNPEDPEDPAFPPNDPVSSDINDRSDWEDDNDNPGDGTIDDIENAGCPCTLTAGEYYIEDSMNIENTLTFDTSSGPIEIYVDGDGGDGVHFDGGTVDVVGDNPVRVFNNGDFDFASGHVSTPHSKPHGPSFWVYMHPDENVYFRSGDESGDHFTGVIYAPGSGSGEVTFDGNGIHVYGAIYGGSDGVVTQHSEVHFDEALLDANADPNAHQPILGDTVGYVQVSTTEIEVSND